MPRDAVIVIEERVEIQIHAANIRNCSSLFRETDEAATDVMANAAPHPYPSTTNHSFSSCLLIKSPTLSTGITDAKISEKVLAASSSLKLGFVTMHRKCSSLHLLAKVSTMTSLTRLGLFCLTWLVACGSVSAESPANLKSIGGRWFVQEGDKPVYFYQDADKFVDLFSYHTKDSNKDGIDNVRLSHDQQFLIIESQGYPNHPTAIFPNSGNPNSIRVQKFTFRMPLKPKLSGKITRLPMGPIGTALNGVVFFNPFEQGGMNAVEGYSEVWLDACCGHPQQTGVYHYHKYPTCVKSPFVDDGKQHSPIIGFAFDGFPIYGPFEAADTKAKDLTGKQALDVCNGHQDDARGYHYHVTPGRFPYIIGGYAGVVEPSNSRGLARAGTGALEDNTQPGTGQEATITAVRPGTAARGKKHSLTIELAPENARRQQLPKEKPTWVQIGPYEAKSIARDGNTVTVEIEIPQDASLGVWLDCHIEFGDDARPLAIKKNDAFRVVE